MKVSNKRFLAVIMALVVMSLLVVGCGAKTADTGATTGEAKTAEVTIGVGVPLTAGSVSFGEGILRGAKLAVDKANKSEEAKAAGLTFKISEGDDQGDPKTGVTAANTFVSNRSLIGVVGHFNSGVSIPASKVYSDNKVVMISPGSTNPQLTQQGFKGIFRTCATDALQGPSGAQSAFDLGFKKAIVVDDSTPYGEGLASEFDKKFQSLGGTTAFTAKTSDKDTDFNALVTKIKAANVDLVYYAGVYNGGALFSKQLKSAGVEVPMMGGDGINAIEYIDLAGKAAEGDLATNVGLPVALLPAAQEFAAASEAMFPGQEMGPFDAYGYDAAMAIINGAYEVAKAEGADKIASPAGRDALIAAVAGISFEGVTGPVGFDENGDTTNKVITLYKVEGGKWVPQAGK